MLGEITIIGCGLIGGSLVKCLRARVGGVRLAAIDRDDVLAVAKPYLDEAAVEGSTDASALLARSELIVLATPVGSICRDLAWVLDSTGKDAVVTDTGSVKKSVVEAAGRHPEGGRFVGGHPMAGREVGGFAAASASLFEGARWFLVPPAGGRAELSLSRVIELADAVGAEAAVIDAEAHDRAMAYVSHAPQLIASAMYAVAASAGVLGEAGPGFRDATRISGGPPAMWRDILRANRREIAAALGDVLAPLLAVRDKLEGSGESDGDDAIAAAIELLERAQAAKSNRVAEPPAEGEVSS